MRTATGLALIAVGAILAFAVSGHPSFLNIQVAGWVLMLTGVAGMLIPARSYGWLRRQVVLRRSPDGRIVRRRVAERRYPPYVMLNPASPPGSDPGPQQASQASPGAGGRNAAGATAPLPGDVMSADAAAAAAPPTGAADPAISTETVTEAMTIRQTAADADPALEPEDGLYPAEETVEEYLPE